MNNRFLAVLSATDAAVLIVGGMLLRDKDSRTPVIGWAGGLLSLGAAVSFSMRHRRGKS